MNDAAREMTLAEVVDQLPPNHSARREYAALREQPEARGVVDGVPEAVAEIRAAMEKAHSVCTELAANGRKYGPIYSHGNTAAWALTAAMKRLEAITAAQQPVQEGGGECPKCRDTGEVCTGYIDGTPEMFDCTCPAAAPPSAPVGADDDGPSPVQVPGWAWASVERFVTIAEGFRQAAGPYVDAINEGGDAGEDEISEVFDGALSHVKRAVAAITQQPAQAAPGVDLEQFRPAVDALYAAGCTKVENGFTLNAKHYDACRLYDVLDKAKAATPPGDDAAGERRDDLDDQDDADLEAWLGDRS